MSDGIVREVAKVRRVSKQLVVTYVAPKKNANGGYASRSVDKLRRKERKCSRPQAAEAAFCSSEAVLKKR